MSIKIILLQLRFSSFLKTYFQALTDFFLLLENKPKFNLFYN